MWMWESRVFARAFVGDWGCSGLPTFFFSLWDNNLCTPKFSLHHAPAFSLPWSSGTTPSLVSPQRPRSHAQCAKQALGDLCTSRSPPKGSAGSNFGFSSESCWIDPVYVSRPLSMLLVVSLPWSLGWNRLARHDRHETASLACYKCFSPSNVAYSMISTVCQSCWRSWIGNWSAPALSTYTLCCADENVRCNVWNRFSTYKVTFLKQMQASSAARLINHYKRRGLSLGHSFSSWGSLSLRAARSICIFVKHRLQLSGKSSLQYVKDQAGTLTIAFPLQPSSPTHIVSWWSRCIGVSSSWSLLLWSRLRFATNSLLDCYKT